MVTASNIVRDGWSAVPGAIFWMLVVFGLGKALFHGFWAMEFRMRLDHRQGRRVGDLRKIQWELRTGKKFTPEAVRDKDALAAAPLLTESELTERRAFLDQQIAATVWMRAGRFLLDCPFCQMFWAATACFSAGSLVGAAPSAWLDWLPTCLAYAGAGAWFLGRDGATAHARDPGQNGRARAHTSPADQGCTGCGGPRDYVFR